MEHWRQISGHAGYYVSDLGRVKRLSYDVVYENGQTEHYPEKLIQTRTTAEGCFVGFKNRTYAVHRLVAQAFLLEEHDHRYVKFLDGDKTNCKLANLQLVSPSDSIREDIKSGIRRNPTPYKGIKIQCVETGEQFESIKALSEHLGLSRAIVSRKLRQQKPIDGVLYEVV